ALGNFEIGELELCRRQSCRSFVANHTRAGIADHTRAGVSETPGRRFARADRIIYFSPRYPGVIAGCFACVFQAASGNSRGPELEVFKTMHPHTLIFLCDRGHGARRWRYRPGAIEISRGQALQVLTHRSVLRRAGRSDWINRTNARRSSRLRPRISSYAHPYALAM